MNSGSHNSGMYPGTARTDPHIPRFPTFPRDSNFSWILT